MTYITVKTIAQVRYVIWCIILWESYEQHKSHFLFLTLILIKKHSTLSGNPYSVSKRDNMSSLTSRLILPPFHQRSCLCTSENQSNRNWAVGKEWSSFVSDTNQASTLLMIFDGRNWNLFLTEFMFICAKMMRLRFSSLNNFRLTFGHLAFFSMLSTWLLDKLDFFAADSNLVLFNDTGVSFIFFKIF